MSVKGHLWTLGGYLRRQWQTVTPPPAREWGLQIEDPRMGAVRISGRLSERDEGGPLLLVVHGLGGSSESPYAVRAAASALAESFSCLRINLRGADRSGEDIYHAGLSADLHRAVTSPELARFQQIVVLGYSLGGHVALRFAVETTDPRVRAVVAVCSPLMLAPGARAIDGPSGWLYRRYLLANLLECYERVAARKPVPTPVAEVRRLRERNARLEAETATLRATVSSLSDGDEIVGSSNPWLRTLQEIDQVSRTRTESGVIRRPILSSG